MRLNSPGGRYVDVAVLAPVEPARLARVIGNLASSLEAQDNWS